MQHRVQYLKSETGSYIGCIAIVEYPALEGDRYSLVEYRLSVRNPTDQFDKDVAKHLALGRVIASPYSVRVSARPNMHEISRAIMKDIAKDSKAPSRARHAAKAWLRKNVY